MQRLVIPVVFLLVIFNSFVLFAQFGDISSELKNEKTPTELLQPFIVMDDVPITVVRDKAGQAINIDGNLPDKTILTFWSAVCAECKMGLLEISKFTTEHPDFNDLYINVKDTVKDSEEALEGYKINIETLYDPDAKSYQKWQSTMPATYYISGGKIRVFFPGRPSAEHLNALLTL